MPHRLIITLCVLMLGALCVTACGARMDSVTEAAVTPSSAQASVSPDVTDVTATPAADSGEAPTSAVPMDTPSDVSVDESAATAKPEYNADGYPLSVDFSLEGRDGIAFTLSEHEGTVVLVNFFATWCPPCREEMPLLQQMYESLSADGDVSFYLIDLTDGQRETATKANAYVDEHGITIPLLYDTDGMAAAIYGVNAIPTTMVVDKEGYVVEYIQGAISDVSFGGAPSTLERLNNALEYARR